MFGYRYGLQESKVVLHRNNGGKGAYNKGVSRINGSTDRQQTASNILCGGSTMRHELVAKDGMSDISPAKK